MCIPIQTNNKETNTKQPVGILIAIVLYLHISLGVMDISTILDLSLHKHHLSLISTLKVYLNKVSQFSL